MFVADIYIYILINVCRTHHVMSHFKSGAVKDDLFIREDVFSTYSKLNTDSRLLKDEL